MGRIWFFGHSRNGWHTILVTASKRIRWLILNGIVIDSGLALSFRIYELPFKRGSSGYILGLIQANSY